jgi:hypothetical protein
MLYISCKSIESYESQEACTVVLIEPRASMQGALEFVVQNILENLPSNWTIFIFPGEENKSSVQGFVNSLPPEAQSRIQVKDIVLSSMTMRQYNELMMSTRILDIIPTEVFLVVQTDSMICSPGKNLINKFLEYDYVGAPWNANAVGEGGLVGNGGFSLRRKSKMLEILNSCSKYYAGDMLHNEDGFFSGGCGPVQLHKPSAEEAEEFSVETRYTGKQMFGIHKAWMYISYDLESVCPGYNRLKSLN